MNGLRLADLPLTRISTPAGRWCVAAIGKLSLDELRSLNEATRDTRGDDEYLAAFAKWMKDR